jgi:hypothetical protein
LQVFVKCGCSTVDGSGVDGDLDLACLACAIKLNRTFFFVKPAAVGGSAKVTDLKGDESVCRVQCIGGGFGLSKGRE